MLDQFDRLRKRNAFLEQYKKFDNIVEEFDDARLVALKWKRAIVLTLIRATCDELQKEYKACESPDYISYGSREEVS